MKVRFQCGMPALSGKAGDLTFCLNRRSGKVFARRNSKPRLSAHHHQTGSVTTNLHKIKPSPAYKDDLRRYLRDYQSSRFMRHQPAVNWVNLYLRMTYAMAKMYPGLELRNLTREVIYAQDLPCISVKRAVEAGLLPALGSWEKLDALL